MLSLEKEDMQFVTTGGSMIEFPCKLIGGALRAEMHWICTLMTESSEDAALVEDRARQA